MKRQTHLFFIVHAAIILCSSNYLFSAAAAANIPPHLETQFNGMANTADLYDNYFSLDTIEYRKNATYFALILGKLWRIEERDLTLTLYAIYKLFQDPSFDLKDIRALIPFAPQIFDAFINHNETIGARAAELLGLPMTEEQELKIQLLRAQKVNDYIMTSAQEKKLIQHYPRILLTAFRENKFNYDLFSKPTDLRYITWAQAIEPGPHCSEEEKYALLSYLFCDFDLEDETSREADQKTILKILEGPGVVAGFDLESNDNLARSRDYSYELLLALDDPIIIKWALYHPRINEREQAQQERLDDYRPIILKKTQPFDFFKKKRTRKSGKEYTLLDPLFNTIYQKQKNGEYNLSEATLLFELDLLEDEEGELGTFFKVLNCIDEIKVVSKPKKSGKSKPKEVGTTKELSAFLYACNAALYGHLYELIRKYTQKEIPSLGLIKEGSWTIDKKYKEKVDAADIGYFVEEAANFKKVADTSDCTFFNKKTRDQFTNLHFFAKRAEPFLDQQYPDPNTHFALAQIITKRYLQLLEKKCGCSFIGRDNADFKENKKLSEAFELFETIMRSPYEVSEVVKKISDIFELYREAYNATAPADRQINFCDKIVMLPDRPNGTFELVPEKDIYIGAKRNPSPRKSPGRTSTSPAAAAAATEKKEDVELIKVSHPEPEQPAAAANPIEVEKVIEKRFVCRNFAPRVKNWFTNPNDQEVKDDYQRTEENGGTKENEGRRAIWGKALEWWQRDQNKAWESIVRHHAVPLCLMPLLEDPTMELGVITHEEDMIKIKVPGSCYTDDNLLREDGILEITIDSEGFCFHWFFRITKKWENGKFKRMVFRASPPDQKAIAHALQDLGEWQVQGMEEFGQFNISTSTRSVKVWIEGSGFYYIFNQNDKDKKIS